MAQESLGRCASDAQAMLGWYSGDARAMLWRCFGKAIGALLRCVTIEFQQGPVCVENFQFSNALTDIRNAAKTEDTTDKGFQMRYFMTLCLKRYQKYKSSKLKHLDTCNCFDIPWGRGSYYLIGKLLAVVKGSQEVEVSLLHM